MRVIFFWKCSRFNADSKNAEKNSKNMFCFWDKCIWIVYINLSLLIREYLSLGVNVLRKGLRNFHVSKSDFCNSITFRVITQDDKSALIKIESVFRSLYHVPYETSSETGVFRHLSKHVFRAQEFRKYRIYEGHLFTKCSKFNADSKNAEKNSKKMFCFWDKCIWIVFIHLSLLIRE